MVRRILVCTAAAAVIGISAGCGGGQIDPDKPPQPTTDPAAIAWAGQVCEAIKSQAINPKELPTPARTDPSPEKIKETMLAYLGTLADSFTAVTAKVEKAGPPPVQGGKRMVSATIEQLEASQQAFEQAKAEVADVPTANKAAFSNAMRTIYTDLKHVAGAQQAISDLKTSPQLSAAFDKAKACR